MYKVWWITNKNQIKPIVVSPPPLQSFKISQICQSNFLVILALFTCSSYKLITSGNPIPEFNMENVTQSFSAIMAKIIPPNTKPSKIVKKKKIYATSKNNQPCLNHFPKISTSLHFCLFLSPFLSNLLHFEEKFKAPFSN